MKARSLCGEAKLTLEDGRDPREIEVITKGPTFGDIATEFMDRQIAGGLAQQTIYKNKRFLFHDAAPLLDMQIDQIKPADILAILKRLEAEDKVHTAHRVRSKVGEVFRYATSTLRAEGDPTYSLRGAIRPETRVNRPAITDEAPFGDMLKKIDRLTGWQTIRVGLQLLAICYTRPIELRFAKWEDVDFEKSLWHLPAEITKMRRRHEVPLPKQAVKLFAELLDARLSSEWVFPQLNGREKPISENGMNLALVRAGVPSSEHCPHGFRASASTFLNQQGFDERVVETSLAHIDSNQVRRTYNRYKYWDERVEMAQSYADYLDELRRPRPRDDSDIV